LTGNHPYLIQLVCSGLFQPQGRLRAIDEADRVVGDALANMFQLDYDTLSVPEKTILQQLSVGGGGTVDRLAASLDLDPGPLRSYLGELRLLGYVHGEGDAYRIARQLLDTWLGMVRGPKPAAETYHLAAIRELLLSAFTARELRQLFVYSPHTELRLLTRQIGEGDALEPMVDKVIAFCRVRDLLADLLREVEAANPRQYARFAGTLRR
jgi:hypothetical protein